MLKFVSTVLVLFLSANSTVLAETEEVTWQSNGYLIAVLADADIEGLNVKGYKGGR